MRNVRPRRSKVAQANFIHLLNSWGGATLAYRRRLIDSPSYTLNHEEVAKALEEGVRFAECLSPESVAIDNYGHASAITFCKLTPGRRYRQADSVGRMTTLPARSVLVAAGTQPNTVLAREEIATMLCSTAATSRPVDEEGNPVETGTRCEADGCSCIDVDSAGRKSDQLLRRSSPVVLR